MICWLWLAIMCWISAFPSSLISAKRLHIPLFHMEAGNRCKDECLPEETNRRIVDVISDVNLCYSEFARKYLADTGLPKERTYQTGSPMAEVLHMNLEKIQKSDVLERLGLEKDKYILLSAHREENIDSEKNFLSLFTAINALAEKYDMPILYSCHPRSKHRLEKSGFKLDPRVRVNEPLGFNDYNKLQMNALAIVSDSGTLPEESSFYLSIGHPIAAVCILLFIFVTVLGDRNRSVKILMGFLLIIITVLGVSYIFPEITGNLFNRGMEDTRSGQYVIFFAQHSWEDLIFGLGINASYSYLGNKNYTYFDNQFMFVMFHYGIFPVIAWLCAYASTLKGSKIYNEQSRIVIRAAKFVGFFVLLAYMGVSTYYQIELGYSGVIVMMLIGKALREKYYGRS